MSVNSLKLDSESSSAGSAADRVTRLAVVTTHPIQYQCPIWKDLARRADMRVRVFFASDFSVRGYVDPGFNQHMRWTVPLLDGYDHEFMGTALIGSRSIGPMIGNGALAKRLRHFRPAACLLNAYAPPFYWHALGVCRLQGIPVILRAETTDVDQDRPLFRRTLRDAALKFFYSGVARFLAIGHNSRAHYERLGVPTEHIGFAPYCVDSDLFESQYARRKRGIIRSHLGIPENALVVLFSGKLIPKKDPLTLLNAVSCLPAVGDRPVHLMFLGDGELRGRLEEAAATTAAGRVHFLGFQPQEKLGDVYTDADMLVLPSLYTETWGLVVNEALQFGVPCIISDRVGCGPDLIRASDTGFVFPHGDSAALQAAIKSMGEKLITRKEEIHQLCRAQVSGYSVRAAAYAINKAAHSV
jgi:glycosyltransferase involved in cell wall biosynthesis